VHDIQVMTALCAVGSADGVSNCYEWQLYNTRVEMEKAGGKTEVTGKLGLAYNIY
jgi:hypothetical protein